MRAMRINADGTPWVAVEPANGTTFSLAEVQAIVGGYFEIHATRDNNYLLVNEDGLRLRLPLNRAASELYGLPIVGDVLVCAPEMIE